jgi:hypothetical protein
VDVVPGGVSNRQLGATLFSVQGLDNIVNAYVWTILIAQSITDENSSDLARVVGVVTDSIERGFVDEDAEIVLDRRKSLGSQIRLR